MVMESRSIQSERGKVGGFSVRYNWARFTSFFRHCVWWQQKAQTRFNLPALIWVISKHYFLSISITSECVRLCSWRCQLQLLLVMQQDFRRQWGVILMRNWTPKISMNLMVKFLVCYCYCCQIWHGCHTSVDSGDLNQAPPKQSAVCSTCIIPALPVNCQFIWMACAFGMSATQPILGWL